MATLKYVEALRGHTANRDVGSSITATEVRKYNVFFTGTDATGADAMTASGVPQIGATLGTLVCNNQTAEALDDCSVWLVTNTYSLPQPGEEAKPSGEDTWAINITVNSVMYEYEAQFDADGNPIQNTAGDPITGIMRPKYDEEMTITYRSTEVNSSGIDACIGKTNSVEITLTINGQEFVYPVNTMLFSDYSVAFVLDVNGSQYPETTLRLRIRQETWTRVVANKGFNGIVDGDPVTVGANTIMTLGTSGARLPLTIPLEDSGGVTHEEPITSPVYLTTSIADHTVERAAEDSPIEKLYFEIYEQADLGTLLLADIET